MILVLGKARSHRAPNLGCRGTKSPGLFDISPKNSAQDVIHEQVHCCDEAASQSLVAHSYSLLNHLNSFCRGMFKLKAKFDADSLLHSLSYFEATQYTCSLNSIFCPQTSTVKSSLFTHAHSSPLSLASRLHQCCPNYSHYVNNGWIFPYI